jgi:hypothetical protein
MKNALIILTITCAIKSGIFAQSFSPAYFPSAYNSIEESSRIYTLVEYNDLILVAGSFDFIGGVTANSLSYFDGEEYLPFAPQIDDPAASIYQVIPTDSSLIVVGRISNYNGAAELINGEWVSIGISGAQKIYHLFFYNGTMLALHADQVHQRVNGVWSPLASPVGIEFDDLAVINNSIYALGNDQIWTYINDEWIALSTPGFVPYELSTANSILFCCGSQTIEADSTATRYRSIEGLASIEFSFPFSSPYPRGSVDFFNNEYWITNQRDHMTLSSQPTMSKNISTCTSLLPFQEYAPTEVVNFESRQYWALNGNRYTGLYRNTKNGQCDFIENNKLEAYHTANATSLSDNYFSRSGLNFKITPDSLIGTIYASSLWISGVSENDTTVSAQTYGVTRNFMFGPIANDITSDFLLKFGRTFQITRQEVQEHINSYMNPFYQLPQSIATWPAHGDDSNGEAAQLAPFVDINSNGLYEPELGDHPDIKGDVCSFLILNDTRSSVEEENEFDELLPDSLHMEDHVMMYLFNTGPEYLQNTVFVDHTLINRSDRTYTEFKCGIWVDFDLGSPHDDYVGCDSLRNCVYGYNGDVIDELSSVSYGFGNLPASTACVTLNQNLDNAVYYNIGTNPINGDPSNETHYFNYLHGKWKNGAQLKYGGNGVSGSGVTDTPANFMFCSDPASTNPIDWNETISGNQPGDRRMVGAVEATSLAPGDRYCLHYAFVTSRALVPSENAHFESCHRMLLTVDSVQAYYDQHLDYCPAQNVASTSGNGTEDASWFQVYPNPGNDYIALSLPYDNKTYTLQVFNDIGQLVMQESFIADDPFMALNTSQWANGVYVVQLTGNGMLEQRKWIKLAGR